MEEAFGHPALLQGPSDVPSFGVLRAPSTPGSSLCPCASQREDEIEAIISISDGLNLVSAPCSQQPLPRPQPLPGSEHYALRQGLGVGAPS